jgi:RNA polymerase primary sigma factor
LTAEEEIELAKRSESGDKNAEKKLVQSNLRLVISAAKKYNSFKISFMDLIQEGNIGLITAASRYRASFNTRFSTYAYLWITQAILRYVRNKHNIITIPYRKEALLRRIKNAREVLLEKNCREPYVEEMATYLGVMPDEINEALTYSYTVSSLDCPVGDSSAATISDLIPDETLTPEEYVLAEESRKEVANLLNELPHMEKEVLYYRYNFNYDEKNKTLRQVGEMLGVSSETVRQMEIRAILRLRAAIKQKKNATA